MQARLLIAALCVALVGCTLVDNPVGPNQVPTDTTTPSGPNQKPDTASTVPIRVGYYVSPTGRADGDGSKAAPWDLQTALSQPGKVTPGDTIWMLGGVYKSPTTSFVSQLTGTADAPVVLRQYPGKRATIDGELTVTGSYAWYWGFEVRFSDPQRSSAIAGSNPTDLPRYGKGMSTIPPGSYNRFINLVIHDLADGLGDASQVHGTEIYGCIIYNNGWIGPDRTHGHGIYIQNRFETKRIIDNIIFNNFSTGLKIGGSDQAFLLHFDVEGNTIFGSGAPAANTFGYEHNVHLQGGGHNMGDITYAHNSIYQIDGNSSAIQLGQIGDTPDSPVIFRDNIVQGTSEFNEWKGLVVRGNKFTTGPIPATGENRLLAVRLPAGVTWSSYDWDENAYAVAPSAFSTFVTHIDTTGIGAGYHDLASWQSSTGWDTRGTYLTGAFSGVDVVVRPNKYEAGRAYITVWNWAGASAVNVDVSSVLKPGDSYKIHHVYDVFGPPIQSGIYSGQGVSIQLKAFDPPTPIGLSIAPPSTGAQFNVFVLERQ